MASGSGVAPVAYRAPARSLVLAGSHGTTRLAAGVVGLVAASLALRAWLAGTPPLAETYYDEALTGLMSRAILRGEPQVFYWGQPYLGAADAYLVAAAFRLFGASTVVLRMAIVLIALLWTWGAWRLGHRAGGEGAGWLAGLAVAVPPVFLTYVQLSSHGETVAMTLGVVVLAAAACLLDESASRTAHTVAWIGLGVAGGLGWWESQMMAMCLVAAAAGVAVARPRVFRSWGPWVALALFGITSLPFWIWNVHHDWVSFRHLATWGGPPPPALSARLAAIADVLLRSLLGGYWDAHTVARPPGVVGLGWLVVLGAYVPGLLLAAGRPAVWAARLWHRERPWRDALDLVALASWLTLLAHLVTWFGSSGILRYAMTFYATLPVLAAGWIAWLGRRGRIGRGAAIGLAVALVGYQLALNVLFVRQAAALPVRPVDQLIARLDTLGVRACYADSRIAQVIAFESGERVTCADFHGLRNYAFLRAVDDVEDPAPVAIVTHRVLKGPAPDAMAAMLDLIGARARVETVGDYVVFHRFEAPPPVEPIPSARWSARGSAGTGEPTRAFDRQVWTTWTAPRTAGSWLELDLGAVYRLAQVSLEATPVDTDVPVGLRVETSVDGRAWERAAEVAELVPGLHWWKGHPRVDTSGRVMVRMHPRAARHLRLTTLGTALAGAQWRVGELFAYQAADRSPVVAPAARQALAAAARELDHWMDDPGGPHPVRTPTYYEVRRRQVQWAEVFAAAQRALDQEPAWEEAHHLYARALRLAGWMPDALDLAVERARADGAFGEVLRWSAAADQQVPGLWRSGRVAARLEAVEALEGAAAAAPARARAARDEAARWPVLPEQARFGDLLDLAGVDLPSTARPGQQVTLRFRWQLLQPAGRDYAAFVHLVGPGPMLDRDHVIGDPFGTSHWAPGERVEETLDLVVPAAAPPGPYDVVVGVWWPTTGRRLTAAATGWPRRHGGVHVGTLTVAP
jgi:hypothetical protein